MADLNLTQTEEDVIYYNGFKYKFSQNYFRRRNDGKAERFLHRAVWVDHNGSIQDGFVVHHKDHNTRNNSIENLELITVSEHHRHHNAELWSDNEKRAALVAKLGVLSRTPERRARASEINAKNRADGKYDNIDLGAFYEGRDRWVKSDEHREFQRAHAKRLIESGVLTGPSDLCRQKSAEWHRSEEGRASHSAISKKAWADKKSRKCICQHCGSEYETKATVSKYCGQNCKAKALRRRNSK